MVFKKYIEKNLNFKRGFSFIYIHYSFVYWTDIFKFSMPWSGFLILP